MSFCVGSSLHRVGLGEDHAGKRSWEDRDDVLRMQRGGSEDSISRCYMEDMFERCWWGNLSSSAGCMVGEKDNSL